MGWFKRGTSDAPRPAMPAFRQCPGCSYDFITGEGFRSCAWGDCPYLPEELKVMCPACNFNFATGEGNPHCGDPPTCQWAAEGYANAARARAVFGRPA